MLTVVLLAGCSVAGTEPPGTTTPATTAPAASPVPSPAGPVTVSPFFVGIFSGTRLDDSALAKPPAARAELRGAGWAVITDAAGAAPAVQTREQVADAVTGAWTMPPGATPELRAPSGQELVVLSFAKGDSMKEPEAGEPWIPHPLTVRTGGRQVRLPALRELSLLVSAPVGQPVTLTVDDGRPQTMDMRTGARVGDRSDMALVYHPVEPFAKQYAADQPQLPAFSLAVESVDVGLFAAVEGRGYAPPGRAWLVVTLHCYVTLPIALTPDRSGSLPFTAGGKTYRPVSVDKVSFGPWGRGNMSPSPMTAVYDVPASLRSGELRFQLAGAMSVSGGSAERTRGSARNTGPLKVQLR